MRCALLCCCMWKLWLFGLSKFSVSILNIMCQSSLCTIYVPYTEFNRTFFPYLFGKKRATCWFFVLEQQD